MMYASHSQSLEFASYNINDIFDQPVFQQSDCMFDPRYFIKQEQKEFSLADIVPTDDLLLTSGYYPTTTTTTQYNGLPYNNATTSPLSSYSYDSFYSPTEPSVSNFDFFSSPSFMSNESFFNDPSLYCLSNQSSPTPTPSVPLSQQFFPTYYEPSHTVAPTPATNSCSNKKANSVDGRPFSCPSCQRAFARKHDLQRHIRVHTGEKPFDCPCCKKTFARTDALKRHFRMEDKCRKSREVQNMKEMGRRRYRNL